MHYFFISYHTVCTIYSILCTTVQYKDSIIPVGSGVSLSGQLANPHVELTSCPYIILLPTNLDLNYKEDGQTSVNKNPSIFFAWGY